ncbi:MAG: hypothetical protein JJ916_09550 [Phycisphaerales bacterium]|nr:hypothetical protein [Phycisphaerales bacterium]
MNSNANTQHGTRGGWLWVSAGVLAALIVVQGAGLIDSPAQAEMASSSGAYTMITTDGGNDEILVVVDSSQESLMVYRSDRNQGLQLLEREDLAGLFSRARARAFGRP